MFSSCINEHRCPVQKLGRAFRRREPRKSLGGLARPEQVRVRILVLYWGLHSISCPGLISTGSQEESIFNSSFAIVLEPGEDKTSAKRLFQPLGNEPSLSVKHMASLF